MPSKGTILGVGIGIVIAGGVLIASLTPHSHPQAITVATHPPAKIRHPHTRPVPVTTPHTATPLPPTPPPVLGINSQGADVTSLQEELTHLGYYSGPVTGIYGVQTEGAVMTFQEESHLTTDGVDGPETHHALADAMAANLRDPIPGGPYQIIVREGSPETLTLMQGDQVILTSLCNTGVPGFSTPLGTWPIYEKLVSQTMQGEGPDGYYSDPGVPYINYFNGGDAVHGFPRASYGFPQSVGCVELPIPVAQRVFDLVPIGTLVTVEA